MCLCAADAAAAAAAGQSPLVASYVGGGGGGELAGRTHQLSELGSTLWLLFIIIILLFALGTTNGLARACKCMPCTTRHTNLS